LPVRGARRDGTTQQCRCDRGTITGRRDYAILVMLTRLGLRGAEAAGLQLADVDWHADPDHLACVPGILDDQCRHPENTSPTSSVTSIMTDRDTSAQSATTESATEPLD
jgi:hypothetical protein